MRSFLLKKIFLILFAACVAGAVVGASAASAADARIFFKPLTQPVGVGDEFALDLVLDSGGVSVNTIAGDLTFSDATLSLQSVSTGNSIVTSWIQSPVISGNGVTFSGIMPGGYTSVTDPVTNTENPGTVITLVFRAKSAGMGGISFDDSHLYLNDGLGTEVGLIALPFSFSIEPKGSNMKAGLADTVPPEPFTPIVSSSPDLYNGAYSLFFSTTDKGSGMDHYEVSEGNRDWVVATSPYLLTDQSLRSRIRVKAVDLSGNYRIETIGSAPGFSNSLLLIPLVLLILLLAGLHIFYKRKMKKFKGKHGDV